MDNIAKILGSAVKRASFDLPSSFVGSTNTTAIQVLEIANDLVKEMAEQYPWHRFFKTGEITLVNGQTRYAMPEDFSYYHHTTFWDRSQRWRMTGAITQQEWAAIKGYGYEVGFNRRYQLRGLEGKLELTEAPSGGEVIGFEYASERYVKPQTWASNRPVTEGDYTYYDENYYTADNSGTTGNTPPTHITGSESDDNINWTIYNGKYTEFLKDTDESILSSRVLGQGVLERFLLDKKDLAITNRYSMELKKLIAREDPAEIIYCKDSGRSRFFYARNGRGIIGSTY